MTDSIDNSNLKSDKTGQLTERVNYPLPDLTYLYEMAGGDEAFVKEIITYFLENGPRLVNAMKEGALSGDNKKLHFAVHKLLPQLTFVGISAAIPDVEKIENGIEHREELFVLVDRVEKTINFGIEDLKKMI
jgi:HPt (histidine-containing phosphotransfer) domain-containing protein